MECKWMLWLLSFCFFTSCEKNLIGEGDPDVVQDFVIKDSFENLEADGLFKMVFVQSDTTYVSVQSHRNLVDNMDIYVKGATLHFAEKKPVSRFEKYEIYFYSKRPLRKIKLYNKVLCQASEKIIQDQLVLEAYENSIFNMFEIDTNELKLRSEDDASMNLFGVTKELIVKSKDKSKVDVSGLRCRVLEADLADKSDVVSQIEDEIKGRVLDNSVLTYDGNPSKNVEIKDRAQIIKK